MANFYPGAVRETIDSLIRVRDAVTQNPGYTLMYEQPAPELDDLVQGVLQRARDGWPYYGEVLSFAALKN